MTDNVGAIESKSEGYEVILRRYFPYTREMVWAALTEPDQLEVDHATGWHTHLDWLDAMLDGEELMDFW